MECKARRHILGVVLAGGLSRRMGGGDKGLAAFGRASLLDEVIRRIAPQVAALVLNANGAPGRFDALGLPVIPDTIEGFVGPLAGVLAGLRWASANVPGATHVLSVPSDAPFLPDDLVDRLTSALEGRNDRIALARSAGELHPVIGLWPVNLAEDLEAALRSGERKVRAWACRHGAVPVDFPLLIAGEETVDPFFNANTPADLAEARRLLGLMNA